MKTPDCNHDAMAAFSPAPCSAVHGVVGMAIRWIENEWIQTSDGPQQRYEVVLKKSDGSLWTSTVPHHAPPGNPLTLRMEAWTLERERRHPPKWPMWKRIPPNESSSATGMSRR